jgi:hypothetical protein
MYVCMYVCMCMYVRSYVYVRTYVRMYVCVCMYVYKYVCFSRIAIPDSHTYYKLQPTTTFKQKCKLRS